MEGMKIIENVTLYKCVYCGKTYKIKRFAENHHLSCRKKARKTDEKETLLNRLRPNPQFEGNMIQDYL